MFLEDIKYFSRIEQREKQLKQLIRNLIWLDSILRSSFYTIGSYRKIWKINRKSIFALMTLSEITSCLSHHECWLQLWFLLGLLGDTFLFCINNVSCVLEPGKICFLLPYLLSKHWTRNLSFRETISFADGSRATKQVFSAFTNTG